MIYTPNETSIYSPGGLIIMSDRTPRWLTALVLFAVSAPAVIAGSGSLTLFHTNDTHASFTPTEATWVDSRPLIGGFAALEYFINEERELASHSLYLDGGDFMTGNPISNIEHNGVKGGALIELFGKIGLDAMALGNHEFDHPRENTLALIEKSDFPILAANLRYVDGKLFTGKGYVIKKAGDVRVGIIGLTPDDLQDLIGNSVFKGLEVIPAVEALNELVPVVDAESDLIVVLSHQGIEGDRVIAQQVEGIDIIIGGHSHTRLNRGEWVGKVLIAHAGSNMRYLGMIDLTVEDDRAVDVECEIIPLWVAEAESSERVISLVERFEVEIEKEYGQVIAQSNATLGRSYYAESDLGNWIADRVRTITGTDVALLNSGGLRKNLEPGEVRKLDIQEILPFGNSLCTFQCTGEELIGIIENNLTAGATEEHGILQSSGLVVRWGQAADKVWVVEARLGRPGKGDGKLVNPEQTYTISTVDYVAISQPERYLGYRPDNVQGTGSVLTDVIMTDVEQIGIIEAPTGRRMIQEKSVDPARSSIDNAG